MNKKIKLIIKKVVIYFFNSIYKQRTFKRINNTSLDELQDNRLFEPELLLLDKFISKGDVVFDIGANIGEYTFVFEKLTGAENVYSFEPILKLFSNLKKVFLKVNVFEIALTKKNVVSSEFKIPKIGNSKYDTRGKLDLNIVEPGETNYNLVKVSCDSIDNFVKNNELKRIHFIKIDVEGHEFDVIKGGKNAIEKFRPVLLVEIEQRHHDFSINKIFNYLSPYYSKIEYFDLRLKRFKSIKEFNVLEMQDYSNIKTKNYVNNFWFYN